MRSVDLVVSDKFLKTALDRIDKLLRYEEALNTIAQQMCLCDPLNEDTLQEEEDEACPSCYANQVLDAELNRKK